LYLTSLLVAFNYKDSHGDDYDREIVIVSTMLLGGELERRLPSDLVRRSILSRRSADIDRKTGVGLMRVTDGFKAAEPINLKGVERLPPLPKPGKILCVGLNYLDHAAEGHFEVPTCPTIFGRFASSLIGDGAPIVRPHVSSHLDFEGCERLINEAAHSTVHCFRVTRY
jgi:2-keto-4-pentenoate hydratase/2-oxohepta-3-ene-1,7-dioic acid hydratase in catechol pathway